MITKWIWRSVLSGLCLVFATGYKAELYLNTGIHITDETLINHSIYPVHFYSSMPVNLTFSDGRQYTITDSRIVIELKSGWNHFTIDGNGIFPQAHKIYYLKKHFTPSFYIAPRAANSSEIIQNTTSSSVARHPSSFSSSCHKLTASTVPAGKSQLSCPFQSLSEEIMMVGPFPSPVSPSANSASKRLYADFSEQLLSFRPPFMLQYSAENLHRTTPIGTTGYEAAGLSALLDGDCHRVNQLSAELKGLLLPSIVMRTYQALCYELEENHTLTAGHYNQLKNELTTQDHASAPALYQIGRWQARFSLLEAEKTFIECAKKFPWFSQCVHRLADIAVAKGQFSRAPLLKKTTQITGSAVEQEVRTALKSAELGQIDEAKNRIDSHPLRSVSFSLIWLSQYFKNPHQTKTIRNPQAYHGRVLSETGGQLVMNYLTEKRPYDTPAIELALQTLARDSITYAHDHQMALLHYLYKQNRCAKAVSIHFPNTKIPGRLSTATEEDIMDVKALCYIRLKRFAAAEEYLYESQKRFPQSWRPIFRLAEVYVAKGDINKGLANYRFVRRLMPPEEIDKEINFRVKLILNNSNNNTSTP